MEFEIRFRDDRPPHVHLPAGPADRRPAVEVMMEEGEHVDVVVDVGAGSGALGRLVHPRTGQQAPRLPVALELFDHAERVVAIAVGPSDDQHRGGRDAFVTVTVGTQPDRPPAPHRRVERAGDPVDHPRRRFVDPPSPLVAPAVAEHRRHRRQGVHRDHVERVVDQVELPEHAAAVVHVVGVAVVGGIRGDDRLQCRYTVCRHVQGVEAGVRRAEHPDLAVRPGLPGKPFDRGAEV
jgi:hypothetical protein